jgi:hypothetical protein
MLQIKIPKPCHEDWSNMTPTQQGAFCASCSKDVVDFTKMTDEEVQQYFLLRKEAKTCGRFRAEQINRILITLPENILLQRITGWKKFMAVVMLAFGSLLFGCDVGTKQDTSGKIETHQTVPTDSAKIESTQMLGFAMPGIDFNDSMMSQKDSAGKQGSDVMGAPSQVLTGDTVVMPNAPKPLMGRPVLLGEPAIIDTTKKPASDTSKCKDTGYY